MNKWKKKSLKIFFHCGHFTPLMSKSFQILDPFVPLLFPKHSENLKSLDIGLWELGTKRPLNGVRNTDKKVLLSKAKFAQKQFFCAAILHSILVKVFKSEIISFHNFSPRIQNLKKIWTYKCYPKLNRHTHKPGPGTHSSDIGRFA